MTDFGEWLTEEINQRGWSHSELARRASVSQVSVSGIISGSRNAGCDFCIKIAKALSLSPVLVLTKAKILPPQEQSNNNATLQELMDIAKQLPQTEQEEVLKYAKFRYQQQK